VLLAGGDASGRAPRTIVSTSPHKVFYACLCDVSRFHWKGYAKEVFVLSGGNEWDDCHRRMTFCGNV
jgi:hypothetical protein